ncbi:putative exonuclease [Ordospora colligata]|uniref:Putative exonuclease n=1 Tax=Ordospora colligata OC4 TaxID=1354746 RepID=A0A0B2UI11_9MICR|nr:putative exonuclease [Ordospora colligata OC4]KHN68844.1 putative exonuclease [Ordospora colligata OC4]TBU13878.1 putative exonuclease [Ordospora colligata]TBU14067.1 putative exonuclease [Ordospora colligata]TBU17736.1 putative exonuclease [Ordospora colligata]
MGISGLLPIVLPKLVRKHISSYRSYRVGIDGHGWMYQVLPCVAEKLFFKIPTKQHISLFESKIRHLEKQGITPVVVLDGDSLLSKEATNMRRKLKKDRCRKEAEAWLMQNNPIKAKACMRQCIYVTNEILLDITRMLERINVEYIISPYESDAELCYLQKIGYIDYIMTEDSDLIAYGSENVLYKFDGAFVYEFNRICLEQAKDRHFKENILDIAILSGCDYLSSVHGVGVVTAHKLLSREKTIERVVEHLKSKKPVPSTYLDDFARAKKTFMHQVVYDPILGKRKHLHDTNENLLFLGSFEEDEYTAERIKNIHGSGGNIQNPILSLLQNAITTKIKRHFVPIVKKRAMSAIESSEFKRRETRTVVDTNTHSPYFSSNTAH